MKNSKKTWGILGTSMGSMLIIVALLTMVGMGSNDTYAVSYCTCPDGYSRNANTCKKTTTKQVCKDSACTTRTGISVGSITGCKAVDGSGLYTCTETKTATCSCGGATPSASGACPSNSDSGTTTTCEKGKYKIGGECVKCELGYYCPGDGSKIACPSGKTSSAGATSESDCKSTSGGGNGGNTGGNGGNTGGNGGNTGGNGGNTGGNGGNTGGNGGNTGGNGGNGNNSGSSNVNQNPGTLTKTPLVIALIGMISVGLGTFTYFKGKKEQNNEI